MKHVRIAERQAVTFYLYICNNIKKLETLRTRQHFLVQMYHNNIYVHDTFAVLLFTRQSRGCRSLSSHSTKM